MPAVQTTRQDKRKLQRFAHPQDYRTISRWCCILVWWWRSQVCNPISRHVYRCPGNYRPNCSAVRKTNSVCNLFDCLSCAHTHDDMSAWDMKKSLGHSRFRDTILLQECAHDSWTSVCKEGRNSLDPQVLIGVCHMQTYANKKAYGHMN